MTDESKILTIGLPKGSLQEATLALFAKAGFVFYGSERSLWLASNDSEIKPVLIRPQEIPKYVSNGSLDCGLSGLDWITETECLDKVKIIADLCYSKQTFNPVRWVLAVANDSPYKNLDDLNNMDRTPRISTELKKITEDWLAQNGVVAEVEFSWGATEAKTPFFADAIVECTETGASLEAAGLRIIDTVFQSTTKFFANKEVYRKDEWKRTKLEGLVVLLSSCLMADTKVVIDVEVARDNAQVVQALIPSQAKFSAWESQGGHILIHIIMDRTLSRDIIPLFARKGVNRITVSSLGMLYEKNAVSEG